MNWTEANWRAHAKAFPGFLAPFARPMGRSERREGAALYVEGLLLPGERKSIEPMAERLGVDSQKLQQLVTDSPWDDQEVWRAIRQEIPTHLEPLWAWIVDETGWLKQGMTRRSGERSARKSPRIRNRCGPGLSMKPAGSNKG